MVQSALHHGLGHRGAVLGQDVLFQAAAVDPDPDGDVPGLAGPDHFLHPAVVPDVAGVDADFVHTHRRAGQGRPVVKVDIRHNGDVHRPFHRLDAFGILGGGAGHPQNLAARRLAPFGLGHVPLDVLDGDIEHGLDRDGVGTADGHISDFYFTLGLAHGRKPPVFHQAPVIKRSTSL